MRGAGDKMGKMLDQLLQMSRVGRFTAAPSRFDYRDLALEALDLLAGLLEGRGIEIRVEKRPVAMVGDRHRLVELWQNLLENALKFMGEQRSPRIEVGAEIREGATVFFVRDNGMGIDPRYHAKVFDLFEKLDARSDGTGLGLALARRIVELYQGTIWVESEGEGRGACFRFTLPTALANADGGTP